MTRTAYHHGDLRAALVREGVAAARQGGVADLGLNRLAAAVGVSASAAYRPFPRGRDDLVAAVADVGWQGLADRVRERLAAVPDGEPVATAQARFRASGQAYVEHVLAEPGLFQVASRHGGGPGAAEAYVLLVGCVDALVAVGALPPGRRRHAPEAAWAAVHGLGVLLTEGPLRDLDDEDRRAVVDRTLDVVVAGLPA